MRDPNGQTLSNWYASLPPLHTEPLLGNLDCDVLVVGAGIAGLTAAYLLAREGRSVVLLEKDGVGSGESGRTTAHFSTALDDRYSEIERVHGRPAAHLAARSQSDAIRLAEEIAREEGIDCDLLRVPGYLFLGPEHDESYLRAEYIAAKEAGVDVEWIASFLPELSPEPWILFRNQMQLHPMKYLAGLKRAIVRRGGRIFTDTPVATVEEISDGVRAATESGWTVNAGSAIVATNTPFVDRVAMHTKQAPYRTYVIAAGIPRDAFPQALLWDTSDPYHYIRLERDSQSPGERILIGCEDHKVGQYESPAYRWTRLEAWARERIPALGAIEYRWSGQVQEPADFLAFAGRNPGNRHVFIVTGDSGNGMTNGTIGARIIADLIEGKANPYAELFSPSRKPTGRLAEFMKENANVAEQYADWLKPSEIRSLAGLAPGEGVVLRRHGAPIAVHRDLQGKLFACSAICPHLKAVLRWNSAEQSWDCPAHGSRFTCAGKRLIGPASTDLESAEVPGVDEVPVSRGPMPPPNPSPRL